MSQTLRSDSPLAVRFLDLRYDSDDSDASALRLVHALFPDWQHSEGEVEFIRFTDGITNTLLKARKKRAGASQEEIDKDAVLIRAYGQDTHILIDREREIRAHSLLASQGLAPPLFARFVNGLIYRFVPGKVCSPHDIPRPEIYSAVAEKLGQWHGTLLIDVLTDLNDLKDDKQLKDVPPSELPLPNLWSVTQRWISALPADSDSQREQIKKIQAEFDFLEAKLAKAPPAIGKPYVFAHCDLLLGNVIIEPPTEPGKTSVHFIDYEYSTPAPAAFDIANHFAEWAGMELDYDLIPTALVRRDFIEHYVRSFFRHTEQTPDEKGFNEAVDRVCEQVDLYRGVPGFYWGVWSLIQAQISTIHFDYASYAVGRFQEYYDWKAELEGSRERDRSVREMRWDQD